MELAKIRESQGDIAEAAKVLQELQVYTSVGSHILGSPEDSWYKTLYVLGHVAKFSNLIDCTVWCNSL